MISTSDDIPVVYPDYLSGAHEFTSGLQWGSCCSTVYLLCVSLPLVACRFVLFLLAIAVGRKDMDVNEHKRLFNITLQRNNTTSIVLNPRGFCKVSITVVDNEQKLQCTAVNHGKNNMILPCKQFNVATNILQYLLRTRNSQSSRALGCTFFSQSSVLHIFQLSVMCCAALWFYLCLFVYFLLQSLGKYLCWWTYQSPKISSTQWSVLRH